MGWQILRGPSLNLTPHFLSTCSCQFPLIEMFDFGIKSKQIWIILGSSQQYPELFCPYMEVEPYRNKLV